MSNRGSVVKRAAETNSVKVGVRIRPRNQKELDANMPVCFSPNSNNDSVEEVDESGDVVKNWPYDNIFGPDCTNTDIFETVGAGLVDAALDGYNTVLFMYGQTSSGKTFTLFGAGDTAGLVSHSMDHVHKRVHSSIDTEYVIKLTYAELYNEELKDLLSVSPNENLKIIDDPVLGPLIQNVTEVPFTTSSEIKALLDEGENRRHFGVTNMNAHSSRSHVIVRLSIESRKVTKPSNPPLRANWGKDKPSCISTLNLVDLAGSERAGKSGTSGQSLKEGSFINKSLLTLGTVISNLSEGKVGAHVPYRNSKLTRLLASALGGNAKTVMITCVSPASGNIAESLSTLRFASRTKRIVNQVQKNEFQDVKSLSSKLAQQKEEMDLLRIQLEKSRELGFMADGEEGQGETLKEKAVNASKNVRSLRFLLQKTPGIIKAFKKEGLADYAKKIQNEIKFAIAGTKDLEEILEETMVLIEKNLPKEGKLLSKMIELQRENELTEILDDHSHRDYDEDTDDEEECNGFFDFDNDAMMLILEKFQMECEDWRSFSCRISITLKEENDHLKTSLIVKDTYIQNIKNQKNTLKSDLEAAKSSRKTFEEESLRIRTEMRSQMDRLRGNMNTLRKQGGEQSQVLEKEMELLGKKCENLEYTLELAEQTKDNLNIEIKHLRMELDRNNKDLSSQSKVIEKLKLHENELSSQLKKSQLDLIHMTSSFKTSDSNNIELRSQFLDEKNELEMYIAELNKEIKTIELQHISIDNTFQTDIAALRLEINHSHEILELQQIKNNRIENAMQTEINRLQEMLSTQNKLYEDLSNEFNDLKKSNNFEINQINNENILLRENLIQLQETVDSINIFVENITKDSLAIDLKEQDIELYMSSNDNSNNSSLLEGDDVHSFDPLSSPYHSQSEYSSLNVSPVSILKNTPLLNNRSIMKSPNNFISINNNNNNNYNNNNNASNSIEMVEHKDDPPSQYNNLCYAMELLLSFFSHSIREDTNMTNFAINEYSKNSLKISENNVILETFEQKEKLFHDSMYRLQDVVNRKQIDYQSLEITNLMNNDEINELKNNHNNLEVKCQQLIEQINEERDIKDSLRIQLDKVRTDYELSDRNINALSENNEELINYIQDITESHSILLSNYNLIQQELEITKIERDKLLELHNMNHISNYY